MAGHTGHSNSGNQPGTSFAKEAEQVLKTRCDAQNILSLNWARAEGTGLIAGGK